MQGLDKAQKIISCLYYPEGHPEEITDPRGNTTEFEWDDFDRTIMVTEAPPFGFRRQYGYDGNNNVVLVDIDDKIGTDTDGDGVQDLSTEQSSRGGGSIEHRYIYNVSPHN